MAILGNALRGAERHWPVYRWTAAKVILVVGIVALAAVIAERTANTPRSYGPVVGLYNDLDSATRPDGVEITGDIVLYRYIVIAPVPDPAAFKAKMDREIRDSVCGQPGMRKSVAAGKRYAYSYRGMGGAVLTQLMISSCD